MIRENEPRALEDFAFDEDRMGISCGGGKPEAALTIDEHKN
jgi:hypothetical protein